MSQPRCPYCGIWFKPEPGKGERQVTCGELACRLAHKKVLGQQWREVNPERTLGRQKKVRDWARERDYRRDWRNKHPGYVERNREQTRERMRKRRQEQRRAGTILGDPVAYLKGLKALWQGDVCKTGTGGAQVSTRKGPTADDVCKTGTGGDPVVGVVDYLIAREMFAKQDYGDRRGGGVL